MAHKMMMIPIPPYGGHDPKRIMLPGDRRQHQKMILKDDEEGEMRGNRKRGKKDEKMKKEVI